jgi:hypothetical protein
VDRKRCLKYRWRTVATCCRFSGVAESEGCSPLGSVLRELEGVTGQEGYCFEDLTSEGCGLERVGNKGGVDCGIECEA